MTDAEFLAFNEGRWRPSYPRFATAASSGRLSTVADRGALGSINLGGGGAVTAPLPRRSGVRIPSAPPSPRLRAQPSEFSSGFRPKQRGAARSSKLLSGGDGALARRSCERACGACSASADSTLSRFNPNRAGRRAQRRISSSSGSARLPILSTTARQSCAKERIDMLRLSQSRRAPRHE
jgi:hypothetical protein